MFMAVEEVRRQSMSGLRTKSAVMIAQARTIDSSCYEMK